MKLPYGPVRKRRAELEDWGGLILPASQRVGAEVHLGVAAARELEMFARDGAVGHDLPAGKIELPSSARDPKGFHFRPAQGKGTLDDCDVSTLASSGSEVCSASAVLDRPMDGPCGTVRDVCR